MIRKEWRRALPLAGCIWLAACGPDDAATADFDPTIHDRRYAVALVERVAGGGGGYGAEALPDIILGPPRGGGDAQGSQDVLSLGRGGSVVVELGLPLRPLDGPELLVFENAFRIGSSDAFFTEPAEVAVSEDGVNWHAFPCAPEESPPNGCAGNQPVFAHPDNGLDPSDPEEAGGDAFDLDDLEFPEAPSLFRYVRITDRSEDGPTDPQAGFDLDALAMVIP